MHGKNSALAPDHPLLAVPTAEFCIDAIFLASRIYAARHDVMMEATADAVMKEFGLINERALRETQELYASGVGVHPNFKSNRLIELSLERARQIMVEGFDHGSDTPVDASVLAEAGSDGAASTSHMGAAPNLNSHEPPAPFWAKRARGRRLVSIAILICFILPALGIAAAAVWIFGKR